MALILQQLISIHALREERDVKVPGAPAVPAVFQSTRSARSATERFGFLALWFWISIHALREERD